MRIAVLDDYQSVALRMSDWSTLRARAELVAFADHQSDEDALAQRLASFDVICVMRERTALTRTLIKRLPKLKLIASTGPINAAIDLQAARDHSIRVVHTGYSPTATVELTWALILASQRHLLREATSFRSGGWQQTVGGDLNGRTLGLLGVGRIGSEVAKVGRAFGMQVLGWSENLTPQRAAAAGAVLGTSCYHAQIS
jgi:phosphoglycerate dehydrogenase-like enzyme